MDKKDRGKTTVLLVDDEPNIIVALEFLVRGEGYRVITAYDGAEALKKIDTDHPEIIVLDVMMPGMDGFEVAQQIRSRPDNQDIRIIFLTARGTQKDRFKGYSSGAEIYLAKPFDNDELVNIINEVVEFG